MASATEKNSSNGNETEELGSLQDVQDVENNLVKLMFQYSVIIIGIVGTLANGIVIMIFLKQSIGTKMSTSNKLILNQLSIDLISCMSLILVYGWKVVNVKLNRSWSYLSCGLIETETLIWSPAISSIMNLIFITLERYWKIVHNSLYQKNYRNWITVMLISLAWIIGYGLFFSVTFATVNFSNGICLSMDFPRHLDLVIFTDVSFVVQYIIPVFIFVVCYGHILVTMKASSKNFDNPEGGEASENIRVMHYRHQMAVIKMMIMIIVSFVVCWALSNILSLLMTVYPQSFGWVWNSSIWYASVFAGLLEACIHPFIYGARVDLVRNYVKEALSKYRSGARTTDPDVTPTDSNKAVADSRF